MKRGFELMWWRICGDSDTFVKASKSAHTERRAPPWDLLFDKTQKGFAVQNRACHRVTPKVDLTEGEKDVVTLQA